MPVSKDVVLGDGVKIHHPELVNIYGCSIGAGTRIGAFVEIQAGARIGSNCKISSHSFICAGVTIEDGVFIGHGVMFTNDRYPRAVTQTGELQTDADWQMEHTIVESQASIGTHATILCGVTIGRSATVGAGSVVTAAVPAEAVVAGVPARILERSSVRQECGHREGVDGVPSPQ